MPQQKRMDEAPERRYEDTVQPSNPPNSVVGPAVRRTAVFTYVGILIATFAIVALAFLYFAARDEQQSVLAGNAPEPTALGTSGERMPREGAPGGFDPAPDFDSTRAELEFRGAGESPQGPMPGLGTAAPLTRVGAIRDESPQAIAGRRVELENVEVDRAEGGTFWVRDGDTRIAVVAPGDVPTVRAGQRVDLTGTVEQDGTNDVRIRASRIDVR